MVNLNGKVFPHGTPVFSGDNRAFRYGDGLFETIRAFHGKLPFLDRHLKRLRQGMTALGMDVPGHFSPAFFQNEISKTTGKRGLHNHRVRLAVFRGNGGLYTPKSNNPAFFIETQDLPSAKFEWQEEGRLAGIFDHIRLCATPISFFKSCNSQPYVLANIFRKKKNWDEVILLNDAGNVVCGGSANIFFIKEKILHTPPISEGCVLGTMRSVVVDLAQELRLEISESPLLISSIQQADEIFLTNAVQGIQWVRKVVGVKSDLKKEVSAQLFSALNELV